ncbi:hypothetical protein K435DRAFT_875951 [Dendrothele bispora CBS 962.96]|uniref:Uncharacterized protein n=1 Tax=Dendrothele bispora (strain CBS 962.96) TaxID=1314807 RepID=A0A4S8KTH2_DENBC|nr:hypothetical protein K435DRAFT_875951 [Dendrothele bispora CBS 962.96]
MQGLCTDNLSSCAGVISASLSGVGTSIDLDTDRIHLNDSLRRFHSPSSTRVNNTGATPSQPQSTTAHATSFATETSNVPTFTATSPPSVPSASSSSVSQADATCTLPESFSATSFQLPILCPQIMAIARIITPVRAQSRHPAPLLDHQPAKLLLHPELKEHRRSTSVTRGGGAGTITDDMSFSTVPDLLPRLTQPLLRTSALPKSTIIGISAIGGVIVLFLPIPILFEIICNRNGHHRDANWDSADYYDQNNKGVNLDVASLDKGGGAYGFTPGGYYPGIAATPGSMASYHIVWEPIRSHQYPLQLSFPDICNYNYAIGPNSGYGADMAAIGGTAPAAGVAGMLE